MSNMQTVKAEEGQSSTIVVEAVEEAEAPVVPSVRMKLKKPKAKKKVAWSSDTVDNENMNKKKSKCCCIYEKPREFGESSSESDDDECKHCKGHTEHKRSTKIDSSNQHHLHSIGVIETRCSASEDRKQVAVVCFIATICFLSCDEEPSK